MVKRPYNMDGWGGGGGRGLHMAPLAGGRTTVSLHQIACMSNVPVYSFRAVVEIPCNPCCSYNLRATVPPP